MGEECGNGQQNFSRGASGEDAQDMSEFIEELLLADGLKPILTNFIFSLDSQNHKTALLGLPFPPSISLPPASCLLPPPSSLFPLVPVLSSLLPLLPVPSYISSLAPLLLISPLSSSSILFSRSPSFLHFLLLAFLDFSLQYSAR